MNRCDCDAGSCSPGSACCELPAADPRSNKGHTGPGGPEDAETFRGLEEQGAPQEQNGLRDELALCSTRGAAAGPLAPREAPSAAQAPAQPARRSRPAWNPRSGNRTAARGPAGHRQAGRACSRGPLTAMRSPGTEAGPVASPLPCPLQRWACAGERNPGSTVTVTGGGGQQLCAEHAHRRRGWEPNPQQHGNPRETLCGSW